MISFKDFIQIAGISSKEEADLILRCGVNFLGFPLRLPVNKEDISESDASEIIETLHPPNYGIVITYLNLSDEIIEFCDKMHSNIVQLHGNVELSELKKLKLSSPNLTIIKSLIVGKYSIEELKNQIDIQSEFVDAFITDSFNPETGATGATGIAHDWEISKELVNYSDRPIILAGGLNPDNVFDAIKFVRPAGVDSHTGVEEEDGSKSKEKVSAFFNNATSAFELI